MRTSRGSFYTRSISLPASSPGRSGGGAGKGRRACNSTRSKRMNFRLVSFEINFREKKIFKYVHVQMALPKKNFNVLFL